MLKKFSARILLSFFISILKSAELFFKFSIKMLPVKLKKELQARDSSILHPPQTPVHEVPLRFWEYDIFYGFFSVISSNCGKWHCSSHKKLIRKFTPQTYE